MDARRALIRGLFALTGLYSAIALLGCLSSRSILYPAPHNGPPLVPDGALLVPLTTSDGVSTSALYFAAKDIKEDPTLVVFHGNGESLRSAAPLGEALWAAGAGVMLVEYRGYGTSTGSPSEEGLYLDAEAALDKLERLGVPKDHTVLMGISLGTGVAAEMALRGKGKRLVLVAPYTSIPEVASRWVPILPTSWIVRDHFDTLKKAPSIGISTLIVHGTDDEVIPYRMGKELAGRLPSARLITVLGGRHNDLFARSDGQKLLRSIVAHARGEAR